MIQQVWLVHPEEAMCAAFRDRFKDLPNVRVIQGKFKDLAPGADGRRLPPLPRAAASAGLGLRGGAPKGGVLRRRQAGGTLRNRQASTRFAAAPMDQDGILVRFDHAG